MEKDRLRINRERGHVLKGTRISENNQKQEENAATTEGGDTGSTSSQTATPRGTKRRVHVDVDGQRPGWQKAARPLCPVPGSWCGPHGRA